MTNLRYVFAISMFFMSFSLLGQSNYWTISSTTENPDNVKLRDLKADTYTIVALKENTFINVLKDNVYSIQDKSSVPTRIDLPSSNGEFIEFEVYESPVFSPELSQKYPEIKSYVGYNKSKGVKAHFSVSPNGIKSMLLHENGETVFMEKNKKNGLNYIVYNRSENANPAGVVCSTQETKEERLSKTFSIRGTNDQLLRKYRIAISASGEYTTFHGGTVTGALSAINATMTRINAIFERDLGIQMEVIATTDNVIFTDAATDPYTTSLTTELQTTLTNQIGEANYDIGHLFHLAPDNGNAGCIGCVCEDGRKGRGFSATRTPTGDAFDIDYVAHEIGHQFGANHTWSFESEGTGVNVEPASGTTIMGYAGITGRNNVQLNSDAYFHYISILQINNFIETTSCDVEIPLSNTPPVVNAGADYTIPKLTAFVLTGEASDSDVSDVLSYNWEQIDNGQVTYSSFGPVNTDGANFRSLPPTSNRTRYFPKLSRVIAGELTEANPELNDDWESVSGVGRVMNFAFTARDNALNGGQTDTDRMQLVVAGNAGPFSVTSQSTSIVRSGGDVITVNWDVANTDLPPVNTQAVDILLSEDGGLTFPHVLAQGVPNDGTHPVILPGGISTSSARLMVKPVDNVFYAVNSSDFSIQETDFILDFENLEYAICQPDNLTINFNYQSFSGFSEEVTFDVLGAPNDLGILFSLNQTTVNGTPVAIAISNTNNVTPGVYDIFVTASVSGIVVKQVPVTLSISGDNFNPILSIAPVDGASDVFLTTTLEWMDDPLAENYDLEVATDIGFSNIINAITLIGNSFVQTGLESNRTYYWRVRPKNDCGEGVFSDAFEFTTVGINCKNFISGDDPQEISSEGRPTVISSVNVIDNLQVTDVKVTIGITHGFVSDLKIRLVSPFGTSITLFDGSCGSNDDIDATFDDTGQVLVCSNTPPGVSGVLRPLESLAAFFGENTQGEWQLIVEDQFDFDGGFLNRFELELCVGGVFSPDVDNDGVLDGDDNCITKANADQLDTDNDGIGDVCDDDDDNDGVPDAEDNCPLTANADQLDTDNDGIGDVCDDDDDDDGVPDVEDNCPLTANSNQLDSDNDGIGDVCDSDVLVSEAITPNGDGINDTWTIVNIERYSNAYVSVYNRLGNKVFSSIGYANDWNGVYQNQRERLPAGSYYYQIDLENNGNVDLKGWIYITY